MQDVCVFSELNLYLKKDPSQLLGCLKTLVLPVASIVYVCMGDIYICIYICMGDSKRHMPLQATIDQPILPGWGGRAAVMVRKEKNGEKRKGGKKIAPSSSTYLLF